MGDPTRRGRSIEAVAIAGIAYAVLTVLAMIRLSRFPSLDLSDAELANRRDSIDSTGSDRVGTRRGTSR